MNTGEMCRIVNSERVCEGAGASAGRRETAQRVRFKEYEADLKSASWLSLAEHRAREIREVVRSPGVFAEGVLSRGTVQRQQTRSPNESTVRDRNIRNAKCVTACISAQGTE